MSTPKSPKVSIFEEQIARKPDHYPWTEDFMRAIWNQPWNDSEFSFQTDKNDFKVKLNDEEREIVVRTLSAIAQIEVAVKTFWAKLGDNLPHPSIRDLGYAMANTEVIHNKAYERLLEELEVEEVFEKNLELEWMEGRVNYLRKYTHRFYKDSKKQFIYALILFTLFVENVSLFSQFYTISWFGRKKLLKDTNVQILYTSREEILHALIGIKLIKQIREEHPELFDAELEEKVIHEAQEAFKAESKIIDWMVNGKQSEFLSADILKEFIKDRINESMLEIGYPKVFDVDDEVIQKTLWFDERIEGATQKDFFDGKPTEYSEGAQSFSPEAIFEDFDIDSIY